MAIRLRDIAEKAGVSVTTVAHVMNGYTKSRIKTETVEKVQKIAAELGYRPNAIALSLRFQRSNTIGMYTGYDYRSLRDPFLAEIYTGIQSACDELDLDFLVRGDMHGKTPNDVKLKLSDGKVDGLIVHAPPGDPVVACLADAKIPAIAIADVQPGFPSMIANDHHGMELLVEYLWGKGHRRIAYWGSHGNHASIKARSDNFLELMRARGGEPTVMEYPPFDTENNVAEMLKASGSPTAVCCWNDYYAYDLVRRCNIVGISVPNEVAIVGFDGLLEQRLPARDLVTVAVPWEDIAHQAVKMIVRQTKGEAIPPLTIFPVTLVPGDTA